MSLTFNQFQQELRKRNIEGPIAVILTTMYEQQRECAEQVGQAMTLLADLVNTVQSFVSLNEAMEGKLRHLNQRVTGERDGVSLGSVPLTDEGDY